MGFMQNLFGGSSNKSSGQSGFSLLPSEIQNAFKSFGSAAGNLVPAAQNAFRPMDQTSDETAAINTLRSGFAPTEQSLKSDISMFMNPYISSVIDQLNRESQGQNSILKQTMDNAGIMGSNRQILGANDIENSRQSNIGSLLSGQYNNAIQNVFNNLIPQRQSDAQNLLNIGQFQRGLNMQQNTAPFTGMQNLASIFAALPQSGGSTESSKGSSTNGILPTLFSGLTGGGKMATGGGMM